jgi:hypothetical protein
MYEFDKLIAGANRNDLQEIYNSMGTIKDGTKFFDREENKAIEDLGSSVSDIIGGGFLGGSKLFGGSFGDFLGGGQGRDRLLKLIHEGKVEEAQKFIFQSSKNQKVKDLLYGNAKLKMEDKEKLSKLIQEKGKALREIKYKKENYSDGFKEWLEYGGYKIEMSVPGDYDKSILYTAYYKQPFHTISSYKLKDLCEKIDKKIKENNEKGLQ